LEAEECNLLLLGDVEDELDLALVVKRHGGAGDGGDGPAGLFFDGVGLGWGLVLGLCLGWKRFRGGGVAYL
jgi:hypothetical protein